MFAKLVFTIVALGACCCTLLFLRQERIVAASEMARVQTKVRQQDEELWKLRVEIAKKVSPQNVTLMAQSIGPLHPLRPEAPVLAASDQNKSLEPAIEPGSREIVTVPPQPEAKPENRDVVKAKDAAKPKKEDAKGKGKKPSGPVKPSVTRYARKDGSGR